jgi:hypothetical protein
MVLEPSMWWSIDIGCHSIREHNVICCHNPPHILMSFTFATIASSLSSPIIVRAYKNSHGLYAKLKHFSLTFCLHLQSNVHCLPKNNKNLWKFIYRMSLTQLRHFMNALNGILGRTNVKRSNDLQRLWIRPIRCILKLILMQVLVHLALY